MILTGDGSTVIDTGVMRNDREQGSAVVVVVAEVVVVGSGVVVVVGSDVVVNTPEQMLQVAKKEAELIDKIARTANVKEE